MRKHAATCLILILFAPAGILAHHSRATFFDMNRTVELEGEITRVQWRHPHVRYWILADPAYGGAEWEMETTPPSLLERQGIGPDILSAGTRVRVAGPPSRFAANTMEVSHVLLPDGREVLLHTGLDPRWTQNAVHRETLGFDPEAVRAAEAAARGIFRVWSRMGMGADDRPQFWLGSYPLTESATAVATSWDRAVGTDVGCRGKDMPWIMASNWPFEFIDEGDTIRLLAEEFDRVRLIHLDGPAAEAVPSPMGHSTAAGASSPRSVASAGAVPSPMGHSTGRWENGDLVVVTTHVNSGQMGRDGVPLSEDVEILERFSLSQDQRRLDYEMTIADPATFVEPVTMTSHWIWRPGETVKPYNCVETPGSWTAVDQNEFGSSP